MINRLVTVPETYAIVDSSLLEAMKKEFGFDRQDGFDREELQDSGALESDAAEPPTLANDVHYFFARKFRLQWPEPPAKWDEAYEIMKPAFRLVSRWITGPSFRTFWNTITHGTVRHSTIRGSNHEVNDLDIRLLEFWEDDLEAPVDVSDLLSWIQSLSPLSIRAVMSYLGGD